MGVVAALLSSLASRDHDQQAFRQSLETVLAFLHRTTVADLFDHAAELAPTRRFIDRFSGQLEHVGLMAPPGMSLDEVADTAIAAGFGLRPMSFPSRLVARELGTISGTELVPTTIFRSSAEGTHSRRVGIEIFIPDTDEATIRSWIRAGVVSHVAIELQRPDDDVFADLARRFEAAGFTVPGFLAPRPFFVPHPSEDLRTLYFDRIRQERARIEVFALGDLAPRPIGRRRGDTEAEAT